jgi:hypothetical protein
MFFVLPLGAELRQMVYGYFRVKEKITHEQAYLRPELESKHMGHKNPNGNIIVDANGQYNKFDGNVGHRDRFEAIKEYYIIGDEADSEFLTEEKIKQLEPGF